MTAAGGGSAAKNSGEVIGQMYKKKRGIQFFKTVDNKCF